MSLLVAMVGISATALFAFPDWIDRGVFRPYWCLARREYATLVSSAFLHADLAHLAFNGFTFWAFGFALERRMGTAGFLTLYVVGLLVSDLGTWLAHRHDPGYRTLGASGPITTVLFAAVVYAPGSSIYVMPIPVPIPAPVFAIGYLAFSFYASRRLQGNVNHDAHLSGALAGLGFVALTDPAAAVRALHRIGL